VSDKPTVVLLPGLDGTGRLFDRLVHVLEPRVRIRRIGYSPDRFLGYSELADFVLGQAPAGAYAIVAESFSGPVAVTVGARRPAGLRGIILSASFVRPPAPAWLRFLPFELLFRLEVPRALLRYYLVGPHNAAGVLPELTEAIASVPSRVLAARVREVLRSDASDALRSCAVPVVLLSAAGDRLLGSRGLRGVLGVQPTIERVSVEGPHLLLQARPIEAGAVIDRYVQKWFAS
jgi:pimeloyl-[acyl-carrier protein] methyl ester esterase